MHIAFPHFHNAQYRYRCMNWKLPFSLLCRDHLKTHTQWRKVSTINDSPSAFFRFPAWCRWWCWSPQYGRVHQISSVDFSSLRDLIKKEKKLPPSTIFGKHLNVGRPALSYICKFFLLYYHSLLRIFAYSCDGLKPLVIGTSWATKLPSHLVSSSHYQWLTPTND